MRKWDEYYGSLESLTEGPASAEFGAELARRVAELLPEGGRILEAGCRLGQQSLALARTGRFDVTLMDYSSEVLDQARRWFESKGVAAGFSQQDVMDPGEPEYDLVFNNGALEHYTFDEQVCLLRGMASRSRRYVLVLVPNRLCYWYWVWRLDATAGGRWPRGKEVPIQDLTGAFQAAGLMPLGQFYGGMRWSEEFINALPGLSTGLRDQILTIHRSGVVPEPQRAYLVGALGCKPETVSVAGPRAYETGSIQAGGRPFDTLVSSLSDALATSIAGERRLVEARARLSEV
jgi:SAM-dependent methyltransferase